MLRLVNKGYEYPLYYQGELVETEEDVYVMDDKFNEELINRDFLLGRRNELVKKMSYNLSL